MKNEIKKKNNDPLTFVKGQMSKVKCLRSMVNGQWSGVRRRGFVIVLGILIATILFSLGFGIAEFSLKQILVTSTIKNSYVAFYAADSGLECAYYWNNQRNDGRVRSVFTDNSIAPADQQQNWTKLACNGEANDQFIYPDNKSFSFSLGLRRPEDATTTVTVTKFVGGDFQNQYDADGINNGLAENIKRVERRIRAQTHD